MKIIQDFSIWFFYTIIFLTFNFLNRVFEKDPYLGCLFFQANTKKMGPLVCPIWIDPFAYVFLKASLKSDEIWIYLSFLKFFTKVCWIRWWPKFTQFHIQLTYCLFLKADFFTSILWRFLNLTGMGMKKSSFLSLFKLL